jgi:chromosome transmission fidelity protein 4
MTTWEDVIPMEERSLPHPALANARISDEEVDVLFGDGAQSRNGYGRHDHAIDDEMNDENMDNDDGHLRDDMSDMDDFLIDDDGAGYAERSANRGRQNNRALANAHMGNLPFEQFKAPKSFQSGSTPFKETKANGLPEEGERRYLAFNMVGVIYTIFQGTHSVVNVEFHNKSQNRNFHFQDYFNYSMATLGRKGAAFAVESSKVEQASNSDGEDEAQASFNPSRIYYRPMGGLADNSEWSMRLPEGEEVTGKHVLWLVPCN